MRFLFPVRFLMAAVLLLPAACAREPDADAVRGAIQAMAKAAEARSSSDVLERVAADFTGNGGEFDRAGLERMLRMRLLAGQAIGVSIGRIEVEFDGDRATARFPMTVADDSGRWLPDRRATLGVTTGWRRERCGWVCYNASWKQE